jgi:hypothetical protein
MSRRRVDPTGTLVPQDPTERWIVNEKDVDAKIVKSDQTARNVQNVLRNDQSVRNDQSAQSVVQVEAMPQG